MGEFLVCALRAAADAPLRLALLRRVLSVKGRVLEQVRMVMASFARTPEVPVDMTSLLRQYWDACDEDARWSKSFSWYNQSITRQMVSWLPVTHPDYLRLASSALRMSAWAPVAFDQVRYIEQAQWPVVGQTMDTYRLVPDVMERVAERQCRPMSVAMVAEVWIRHMPRSTRPVLPAGMQLWESLWDSSLEFRTVVGMCPAEIFADISPNFWRKALSCPSREEREAWILRLGRLQRTKQEVRPEAPQGTAQGFLQETLQNASEQTLEGTLGNAPKNQSDAFSR